ncbi:palmitoyl-protein thioesterase 1-like [Copidosoma floridanum]|uniref:palmitoyl-protein thioesterase 1-like n=1 Tax=Copidosoma floridanum TaxID=29053 RepID=UPI000C6FC4AE|nr:palmitoyl-protein thioesterase 1-like [Copidosoma floridanum]
MATRSRRVFCLMATIMATIVYSGVVAESPVPVVLWHGMGDSCCFSFSLGQIRTILEEHLPGVYVKSVKIGDSLVKDVENSYFKNVNDQVREVCEELENDKMLSDGFNAIGFSQGAQFLQCFTYRVVQNHLVQAEYWHDPLNEDVYKQNSIFLADINNERNVNKTYIENLTRLKNFVLVKFDKDTMVQPVETEWFGFYSPGQAVQTEKLEDSAIYKEDRLGLADLQKSGRLHFLAVDANHLQFTDEWFVSDIISGFLK